MVLLRVQQASLANQLFSRFQIKSVKVGLEPDVLGNRRDAAPPDQVRRVLALTVDFPESERSRWNTTALCLSRGLLVITKFAIGDLIHLLITVVLVWGAAVAALLSRCCDLSLLE